MMQQFAKLKRMELAALAAAAFLLLLGFLKKSYPFASLALLLIAASIALEGLFAAQTGRQQDAVKNWACSGLLIMLLILFLIAR